MELGGLNSDLEAITKKYESQRLGETYGYTPARELSTRELEDYAYRNMSTPRTDYLNPGYVRQSLASNGRQASLVSGRATDESKSVASAMRALQDRIRALEGENSALRHTIKMYEDKSKNELERLQQRYYQDTQYATDKEKTFVNKQRELEEELRKHIARGNQMQDRLAISETEAKHLREELKRTEDLYRIEKENWSLERESYHRALSSKNNEEKSLAGLVKKLESEKEIIADELKQQRNINQTMQAELEFIQKNSETRTYSLQKNLEQIENELAKQNSDNLQKLKQVEIQNKSLVAQLEQRDKQVNFLKSEVEKLQRSLKDSEDARVSLLSQSSKENLSSNTPRKARSILKTPRSNSRPASTTRMRSTPRSSDSHTPRSHRVAPINRSKSRKDDLSSSQNLSATHRASPYNNHTSESEDSIAREIASTEREINEMNKRYKSLLRRSYEGGVDLPTIRAEIGNLAQSLEVKSNELYLLKKKQSSILRDRLQFQ